MLARAGVASRRAADELIAAGRVQVNGRPAELGRRIDPDKDVVEVDGSRIPVAQSLVHYLLNKPRGVVTTADDPEGRPTVLDLVDPAVRVWPVGRLDVDTEGALLLTNDGDLTLRLTHPRFKVPKTYVAEVRGAVSRRTLRALAQGIELEEGRTAPAKVQLLGRTAASSLVELSLSEGRNRQVRRMFEATGHDVIRLARTAIGPLILGRLKPGQLRRLAPAEVQALYRACGL